METHRCQPAACTQRFCHRREPGAAVRCLGGPEP
ncbi:hypothetical protein [Pseudomonas viridiflava]